MPNSMASPLCSHLPHSSISCRWPSHLLETFLSCILRLYTLLVFSLSQKPSQPLLFSKLPLHLGLSQDSALVLLYFQISLWYGVFKSHLYADNASLFFAVLISFLNSRLTQLEVSLTFPFICMRVILNLAQPKKELLMSHTKKILFLI